MNYTDTVIKRSKQNIFYIQGKTDIGIDCYYYVLVKPHKIDQFQKIDGGDLVNLDDYGTVIHKGFGEPSTEVKKQMLDEYGFE